MFGEKARQIEGLTRSVKFWKDRFTEESECRQRTLKDLSDKLIRSVNQNRDYETHIETLDYALSESKGLNQALEDENRDLVRQLDLYRALLSSVRINVSLPARKK